VLLDAGMDKNGRTEGDRSSPMLVSIINGQYDIAMSLLDAGRDPNLGQRRRRGAAVCGTEQRMAAAHLVSRSRPQGSQQKASYLQTDGGAAQGRRRSGRAHGVSHLVRRVQHGRMGVEFTGATAFWRAAYALGRGCHAPAREIRRRSIDSDHDVRRGEAGERSVRDERRAAGGPHVPPFHAASGVGYGTSRVAQQHRHVPDGWMPAAKYFSKSSASM
jgi:hypothetical protein